MEINFKKLTMTIKLYTYINIYIKKLIVRPKNINQDKADNVKMTKRRKLNLDEPSKLV